MSYFNNEKITDESIQKTRRWFYDNCMECIRLVETGEDTVNDMENYIVYKKESADDYMSGKCDNGVWFLQRAYYIQTGKSIALL